jgi:hypothetical protein
MAERMKMKINSMSWLQEMTTRILWCPWTGRWRGGITRGLAICGSGVGACVAANKVPGVRAALITDSFSAHQGEEGGLRGVTSSLSISMNW